MRDTADLTLAQHGAYTLLLDYYYSTELPLPPDMVTLYRICRAFDKAEQEAVRFIADNFFPLADDGFRHNYRADKEIPDDLRLKKTRQVNGRLGGRPKKETKNETKTEPKNNLAGFENETKTIPETKAHQTPDTRQELKAKTLERQAARFAEFWMAYPLKKGKAEALAKWKVKGYDAIADTIIADVKARIVQDRAWLDGYIPHGSTYVCGMVWEDAIEPVRSDSRRQGHDAFAGVA